MLHQATDELAALLCLSPLLLAPTINITHSTPIRACSTCTSTATSETPPAARNTSSS